ncbi:hypothetical protein LZZ85_06425 [Terrimonas sp. NA20]|uniref:Uncharacterized protein n=1 Tax=Terrimonas ginsenosidimutans TaxID=2908004 RepID=A0ABS9KNK4_9BACT|nr:hypothetical protein [Terrimonas ginsenosidimutans]MCG2613907.1 hypothetical protein [Terrimonas ginsenosidimutans]
MRKKLFIKVILVGIAIAGTAFVLLAFSSANKTTACPEQESMENCAKKGENGGGGVIWENISHQFFSSF